MCVMCNQFQAMLDFTFYTESILTDEEFPQERCQSQVEKLLSKYAYISILIDMYFGVIIFFSCMCMSLI